MTFSEFVLEARKRLHDYRNSDMQVITDASKDGIRFTSEQLQSICRGALQEMLRTFRALKLNNYINEEVQNQFVTCKIKANSGEVEGLEDRFQKVVRIQAPNLSTIYDFVDFDSFFSKKWRARTYNTSGSVPTGCTAEEIEESDETWFTVVWDKDNHKVKVLTLPIPSKDVDNCLAAVIYPLDELYKISGTLSTTPLPFIGVDDMMLDYAEKQARQIDHNPKQVELITNTIQTKLQELRLELQKSNR